MEFFEGPIRNDAPDTLFQSDVVRQDPPKEATVAIGEALSEDARLDSVTVPETTDDVLTIGAEYPDEREYAGSRMSSAIIQLEADTPEPEEPPEEIAAEVEPVEVAEADHVAEPSATGGDMPPPKPPSDGVHGEADDPDRPRTLDEVDVYSINDREPTSIEELESIEASLASAIRKVFDLDPHPETVTRNGESRLLARASVEAGGWGADIEATDSSLSVSFVGSEAYSGPRRIYAMDGHGIARRLDYFPLDIPPNTTPADAKAYRAAHAVKIDEEIRAGLNATAVGRPQMGYIESVVDLAGPPLAPMNQLILDSRLDIGDGGPTDPEQRREAALTMERTAAHELQTNGPGRTIEDPSGKIDIAVTPPQDVWDGPKVDLKLYSTFAQMPEEQQQAFERDLEKEPGLLSAFKQGGLEVKLGFEIAEEDLVVSVSFTFCNRQGKPIAEPTSAKGFGTPQLARNLHRFLAEPYVMHPNRRTPGRRTPQ